MFSFLFFFSLVSHPHAYVLELAHATFYLQLRVYKEKRNDLNSPAIYLFFSMKIYAKEQEIQDSIANVQYPNHKDTNRQNDKEANIKVKLTKVWI